MSKTKLFLMFVLLVTAVCFQTVKAQGTTTSGINGTVVDEKVG